MTEGSTSTHEQPWVMTMAVVAKLLTVTTETVQTLHRTGQLRGVIIGRHLRWRPDDVRRFIAELKPRGEE